MFTVYDNGRKAKYPNCLVDPSWNQCEFETLDEAVSYAVKWVGDPGILNPSMMTANTEYDYSGYGDVIEIRETE